MAFLISVLVFIPNRNLVSDIQGKAGQLLSRGTGSAQQVGGAGGAYDNQQMIRVRFFYFFYLFIFFRKHSGNTDEREYYLKITLCRRCEVCERSMNDFVGFYEN